MALGAGTAPGKARWPGCMRAPAGAASPQGSLLQPRVQPSAVTERLHLPRARTRASSFWRSALPGDGAGVGLDRCPRTPGSRSRDAIPAATAASPDPPALAPRLRRRWTRPPRCAAARSGMRGSGGMSHQKRGAAARGVGGSASPGSAHGALGQPGGLPASALCQQAIALLTKLTAERHGPEPCTAVHPSLTF